MTRPTVNLKNPYLAGLLAWLVPGLGHFYQGRTGKGWLYAICILGLYFTGFALGEGKIVYWRWLNPLDDPEQFRFSYLCQLCVGLPALPALLQATLQSRGHEPVLWGFMAMPPEVVVNGLYGRLGRMMEVGSVYTMMAGLLNVLAIYDALCGPAHPETEATPAADAPPTAAGPEPALDGLNLEVRA